MRPCTVVVRVVMAHVGASGLTRSRIVSIRDGLVPAGLRVEWECDRASQRPEAPAPATVTGEGVHKPLVPGRGTARPGDWPRPPLRCASRWTCQREDSNRAWCPGVGPGAQSAIPRLGPAST
ncbi:hypothetical protein roselon_02155 [Roseibacterium elongatum DSM 19469]|uniref:Uncharacterized protein n=1 Tax=Roseicyclus elongatus DSM 19469 TaxID=1294273 RepID=W8SPR1_9RHOB|nr:hypothetical protein roselon_02155 [Roseibacterium elongatum DSM 19469]